MFEYEFMRHAFMAGFIVALLAGSCGYFLVLRGQAFAAHALSHISFTGATGALLIGLPPFLGLVGFTVFCGLLMGYMNDRIVGRDVIIGIVLAFAMGLGLLFLHFFTSYATQMTSLLFGNILGIDYSVLVYLYILGIACVIVLALLSRPLLFTSLQPEVASSRGVPVKLVSTVFLGVVAVATAECAQLIGVLMVFVLIVGPAATALRMSRGIYSGLIFSCVLAWMQAWVGIVMAWYTDYPVTFWISALSTLCYVSVCIVSPKAR